VGHHGHPGHVHVVRNVRVAGETRRPAERASGYRFTVEPEMPTTNAAGRGGARRCDRCGATWIRFVRAARRRLSPCRAAKPRSTAVFAADLDVVAMTDATELGQPFTLGPPHWHWPKRRCRSRHPGGECSVTDDGSRSTPRPAHEAGVSVHDAGVPDPTRDPGPMSHSGPMSAPSSTTQSGPTQAVGRSGTRRNDRRSDALPSRRPASGNSRFRDGVHTRGTDWR